MLNLDKKYIAGLIILLLWGAAARSEDAKKPTAKPAQAQPGNPERVDVEAVKERYWAKGDESALGVVQNRTYSKAHKWQFGLFAGVKSADPFIGENPIGLNIGYHFNEFFSLSAIGWKTLWKKTGTYDDVTSTSGFSVNYAEPKSYMGLESAYSLMYGKISLLGKKIIYYDLYLLAGVGSTKTEAGSYFTYYPGIGQRFFVSETSSIRLDYRAQLYKETILEKQNPASLGAERGQRSVTGHVITFGVDFLFGGSK